MSFKGFSNICNSMATICTKITFFIKSKFSAFVTSSKGHTIFKTNSKLRMILILNLFGDENECR